MTNDTKTEVTGRNGYIYDATQVKGNLYVVGRFIVKVKAGRVTNTICRATKTNISRFS